MEADPELAELGSESFWKRDPHGTLWGSPQEHGNLIGCAVTYSNHSGHQFGTVEDVHGLCVLVKCMPVCTEINTHPSNI